MIRRRILFYSVAALLGGCTLAPKYQRPDAPVGRSWPRDSATDAVGASTASDLDWRDFFTDPRLQRLISVALENNRDLRVAALRVEQARAQYRIQRSELFPGFQGDASALRQKTSGTVSAFNNGTILCAV
jgi:multidrug efflux system outer membrane protein